MTFRNHLLAGIFFLAASLVQAQDKFPANHLSLNVFRNPSIGLEYQHKLVSVHAGYYPTGLGGGVSTAFLRAGASFWFLPWGKKEIPSSLYAGASYLRGLTRDYKQTNALGLETGVRWYVWKGLNLRLGVIALMADGKDTKINPTTSISYSFKL